MKKLIWWLLRQTARLNDWAWKQAGRAIANGVAVDAPGAQAAAGMFRRLSRERVLLKTGLLTGKSNQFEQN